MFPDFIDACSYDDPEDEGKVRPGGGRRGLAEAGGGWRGQVLLVHFPVAHTAPQGLHLGGHAAYWPNQRNSLCHSSWWHLGFSDGL